MAYRLEDVISDIYSTKSTHHFPNVEAAHVTPTKYMDIPISGDTFELPVFAFPRFVDAVANYSDILVAQLYSCGQKSYYKSLDTIMKEVLLTDFYYNTPLIKVEVAESSNIYYATLGAVFNADLQPLMMMSWIIGRRQNDAGNTEYYYIKPLLRLSPGPYIAKEDALQRFIGNKLLTKALEAHICVPNGRGYRGILEQSDTYSSDKVRIVIDDIPFTARSTDVPSISVTNESLLQLAADHIDEIPL